MESWLLFLVIYSSSNHLLTGLLLPDETTNMKHQLSTTWQLSVGWFCTSWLRSLFKLWTYKITCFLMIFSFSWGFSRWKEVSVGMLVMFNGYQWESKDVHYSMQYTPTSLCFGSLCSIYIPQGHEVGRGQEVWTSTWRHSALTKSHDLFEFTIWHRNLLIFRTGLITLAFHMINYD